MHDHQAASFQSLGFDPNRPNTQAVGNAHVRDPFAERGLAVPLDQGSGDVRVGADQVPGEVGAAALRAQDYDAHGFGFRGVEACMCRVP